MEIRWTHSAVRDLDDAVDYIATRDPEAAARVAALVIEAVESLVEQPEMGAVVRDLQPSGRFRHIVRGKYRIIYEVRDEAVFVMRVWHASRNPAVFSPE